MARWLADKNEISPKRVARRRTNPTLSASPQLFHIKSVESEFSVTDDLAKFLTNLLTSFISAVRGVAAPDSRVRESPS